ncbi:hypothetical protein C0995_000096 [Termitomyces sp. Mi166|nr:hypothetical protein C0995_000096 [Termitomyces sp. Mi166\
MLESLFKVAGVQSFILAVDPINSSDGGFLGGTVVGREFWRGMRNGGDTGAKAFKAHCFRDLESYLPAGSSEDHPLSLPNAVPTPPKLPPARSLKTDLYDAVRKALRTVSGVRNAEMKWTNHERLDVYGVRLVGWPSDIPVANPSSLKHSQNKIILDCLESGTLRFERLFPDAPPPSAEPANDIPSTADEVPVIQQLEDTDNLSWALDPNPSDPPMPVTEDFSQPTASQTEETEDALWQATDDTSALIGDLWTDIDIAGLLQNASHSRKRPRSELEHDDTLDR